MKPVFYSPVAIKSIKYAASPRATKPQQVNSVRKTIPPPDEESLKRLNAMAKEFPFCIYYKEKSNDPL